MQKELEIAIKAALKAGEAILEIYEKEDFGRVRQMMIDCVLATDMALHFKEINRVKDRMDQPDYDLKNEKDKHMITKLVFHLADISNPTKRWQVCRDWTELLYVEFFA